MAMRTCGYWWTRFTPRVSRPSCGGPPLAADPGTELVKKHPGWLQLNADGSKQKISYWNSWYLCPADLAVIEYHKAIVVKALKDWGFDGLKLDGQHMNGAPPCY